jgi:adenylosuccinate synthase
MGPFPTELFDSNGEMLRSEGGEFGATTGRPRRCGWFDIPLVKYSSIINGLDYVALTKLDVLSIFKEIKVCVNYRLEGKLLKSFPTDFNRLSSVEPVYESLPGWNTDISTCTSYNDLPQRAKDYLGFISDKVGIIISIISVGPKREQTFSALQKP